MKSHSEFIEEVNYFKSTPAKTCRAMGPESQEDINMYANDVSEKNHAGDDNGK